MTAPSQKLQLEQLQAENARLKQENVRLRQDLSVAAEAAPAVASVRRFGWRSIGSLFFIALSVGLLVAANLLFWAGSVLVKPDKFAQTVTPIVQNSEVQTALAGYTTTQLFNNVDVQQYVESVLPEQAAPLAAPIAGALRSTTESTLNKVLQRPEFQQRVNTALVRAQTKYVAAAKNHGSDGAIDLNELYQQISGSLQDTRLSFLADRQLPARVGSIQVMSGPMVGITNTVANNIDLWRVLSLIGVLLFAVLSVYLARRRRRAVVELGVMAVVGMFITLVAIRISREIVVGKVDPAYAEAVRQAYQIFMHLLVLQTALILCFFAIVTVVAWVSGPARSAALVRSRTSDLLAGRAHTALFGDRDNAFTRWLGAHKSIVQWSIVAVTALSVLIIRLTPTVLIVSLVVLVALVLLVELIAAPAWRESNHSPA